MGIIQKRADELKPGDVLPVKDGSVVLVGVRYLSADCVELMGCAMTDDKMDVKTRSQREFINTRVAVESPDLTPAQQHAEELARALMDCLEALPRGIPEATRAAALLDKVLPPEPPTLAEALAELEAICNSHDDESEYAAMQRAGQLLDRARRAGVL